MPKIKLGIDTLTAARQRIADTFENFPRVYVSFSGGKDSTVMLHLVADEARKRGRKFGVLFIDLEGQYKLTIDHSEACLDEYADLIDEEHWVALPMALRNAVSTYQPKWLCWDPEREDAWIRPKPKRAVPSDSYPFFHPGMEFEEFMVLVGDHYGKGERTACLVGIRADESLNRYRTIASTTKTTFGGRQWTSRVTENVYNVYPIYDMTVQDIWTYHGKNPDRRHNELYDRMHLAGLTPAQMRICQPYGDDQRRGLWLFHLIEPETWARVVARVNGANGGALYVQEWGNINGYRKITKPAGHTWRSFAELLVSSMPPGAEEHFRNKILLFQKWWIERGYDEGIPDEADAKLEAQRLVPSWRRVCKSLLRNDYWGKGLGFSQHKSAAYSAYQDLMRRRKATWGVAADQLAVSAGTFREST
jgi:predicted phosphoadenosine phosphosulfate sulfurtransferase